MSTNEKMQEGQKPMRAHKVVPREEWLAARLDLLEAEKELTRRGDEQARRRQELPWVRVEKDYRFDTDEGRASLPDLFRGRSQLLVYHFMFGPDYKAGCLSCSSIADGFNGIVPHLMHHDVAFCAVSQAPLAKLQAYKERMGWSFPWASSYGSDFNYDFHVSETKEQQESGVAEYNFKREETKPVVEPPEGSSAGLFAAAAGVDYRTYTREGPGMECVRAAGWGRLSHLLGVCARGRYSLGHVPVARPRAARPQRGGSRALVAPP